MRTSGDRFLHIECDPAAWGRETGRKSSVEIRTTQIEPATGARQLTAVALQKRRAIWTDAASVLRCWNFQRLGLPCDTAGVGGRCTVAFRHFRERRRKDTESGRQRKLVNSAEQ
jgi:hypothetical protein